MLFTAKFGLWTYQQHQAKITQITYSRTKTVQGNLASNPNYLIKNYAKTSHAQKLALNTPRQPSKKPPISKPKQVEPLQQTDAIYIEPIYPAPSNEYITSSFMKELLKNPPTTPYEGFNITHRIDAQPQEPIALENAHPSKNWMQSLYESMSKHGGYSSCTDAQRLLSQCSNTISLESN